MEKDLTQDLKDTKLRSVGIKDIILFYAAYRVVEKMNQELSAIIRKEMS